MSKLQCVVHNLIHLIDDNDIMSRRKFAPYTQVTSTKTSVVDYKWVITFNWDLDEENPFEIYQRNSFSAKEIPNDWYHKALNDTCRHQKLQLTGLRGQHYSVFCKIEKGRP